MDKEKKNYLQKFKTHSPDQVYWAAWTSKKRVKAKFKVIGVYSFPNGVTPTGSAQHTYIWNPGVNQE